MTGRILDPRAVADMEAIEWEGALIHHSATAPTVTAQSIRDYHVKKKGWRAAGYHGFVSMRPDGGYQFEPGRDLSIEGSHCKGKNWTHLGLCLIGNFMDGAPPAAQLEVAAEALAEWCVAFDFGPEDIDTHRAHWPTDCPGDKLDILDLRARVLKILAEG